MLRSNLWRGGMRMQQWLRPRTVVRLRQRLCALLRLRIGLQFGLWRRPWLRSVLGAVRRRLPPIVRLRILLRTDLRLQQRLHRWLRLQQRLHGLP
jgi:hypothetical protein